VRERLLDAVRGLPEDATVEDAIEQFYFLAKVEEGLRQAEAGEAVAEAQIRQVAFIKRRRGRLV